MRLSSIPTEKGDDDAKLEAVIRWTADHGGKFVLASGLTLADQQKSYFFEVLGGRFPDLLGLYQKLYQPASYAPRGYPWHRVALRIRELCERYGIRDRMPRPIIPGDKRARNKRIVERLADQVYEMEIHQEPGDRVWAYRKAAWAVEDLEQDIGLIYQTGIKGPAEHSGCRAADGRENRKAAGRDKSSCWAGFLIAFW